MKAIFPLLLLLTLFCGTAKADENKTELKLKPSDKAVALKPYFSVVEDSTGFYNATLLFKDLTLFRPISELRHPNRNHTFWLLSRVKNEKHLEAIISFANVTYVDLYLMADTPNASFDHRQAGAFRPIKLINPSDSRFHFRLHLDAKLNYLVLLKTKHVKNYPPIFDFQISEEHVFSKAEQQRRLIDYCLQGAALLLVLYALLTWAITQHRSYLYLSTFVIGFNFYNLALNGYLIDWFFPENPILGWRFTIHFLHIGLTGILLLVFDFWGLHKRKGKYTLLRNLMLSGIGLVSISSFLINYYTRNFKLMSLVNTAFSIIVTVYFVTLIIKLWRKLDNQGRFLGYGVILYLLTSVSLTVMLWVMGEVALSYYALLSAITLVLITLFFLSGINIKLWQTEKNSVLYLQQLTQLQFHQNQLLEENVAKRTEELKQRSEYIETLMNELNHRVKNNLQLLYSLNSLQLLSVSEPAVSNILKDNISRVKAMMLVNENLSSYQKTGEEHISASKFIKEIVDHSKKMFNDNRFTVSFSTEIDETLFLESKFGLSLGLIVSELIVNSFKHAFQYHSQPEIYISIWLNEQNWEMKYSDNGSGLPDNATHNFGLDLIDDLTRQLRGTIDRNNENGLTYIFYFPKLN
ncbi:7TM diverse intracellular signaling domain-containing protein [Pedobacter xixiisoli]|uniref:histidine kinase n=1 Tax=Pedobacter xixiisoli TaxID=1476464 RepID=A0A286AE91_9SPHI|nr:7TM diverse intracellular signaling domain-containing protein [Pedobacter xixiisoli]SOD20209.1 Two-component sensor histidine kinase, contains HisKA and HATPase domains [Pedobacter xixiisoli]